MRHFRRVVSCIFLLGVLLFVAVEAHAVPFGILDEWDTTPLPPYDIEVLSDGSVWLTYKDEPVDAGKLFTLDPSDGTTTEYVPSFSADSQFETMDRASDDTLWIADSRGRLVHFDPATGVFTDYPLDAAFGTDPEPYGVRVAADGSVWCTCQADRSLGRFDPASGDWQRFPLPTPADNVPGRPVAIAFDADGAVWFTIREWAGQKAGLGKLDPTTGDLTLWIHLDLPGECFTPTAFPRNPWEIDVVDGIVWFVDKSGNSLLKYDPLHPEDDFSCFPLTEEDGSGWDVHFFDVDDDGVFWLAAFAVDVIATFDPATETFDTLPLADGAKPMGISISPTGDIWFAETFGSDETGGVGRFHPFPIPPVPPDWIPRRPPRNLYLIDCGPCPHCFAGPCDPRVNVDLDEFLIWDPAEDILEMFSLSKLELKPEEGPLAAAAPIQFEKGPITFVAAAPNALDGAGAVLFFTNEGEILERIDGREAGERLGFEMDVQGAHVVVASTQGLLRLEGPKVVSEMSFSPDLFAQRGVRLAFTEDMDGDERPDILLGAPYATVGKYREAGGIQLIGSKNGEVLFVAQGRTAGERLGDTLQPLDFRYGPIEK